MRYKIPEAEYVPDDWFHTYYSSIKDIWMILNILLWNVNPHGHQFPSGGSKYVKSMTFCLDARSNHQYPVHWHIQVSDSAYLTCIMSLAFDTCLQMFYHHPQEMAYVECNKDWCHMEVIRYMQECIHFQMRQAETRLIVWRRTGLRVGGISTRIKKSCTVLLWQASVTLSRTILCWWCHPGADMTLCIIIEEMPCIWRLPMSKTICPNTIYHSRTNLETCSPTVPNNVNGDSSPSWQNPPAANPAESGITNTLNMVVEENHQVYYYKQYESQQKFSQSKQFQRYIQHDLV